MKVPQKVSLVIMFVASLVFLVSCETMSLFDTDLKISNKRHKIDLTVNSSAGELEIDTKPIGDCKGRFKKNGCVEVARNKSASIEFKLRGPTEWQLIEFRICSGGDKRTKDDICTLEEWQRSEFAVKVKTGGALKKPNAKGEVKLTELSEKPLRKFLLVDYNGTKHDYYYLIQACPSRVVTKNCLWTDPPVVNKGRN